MKERRAQPTFLIPETAVRFTRQNTFYSVYTVENTFYLGTSRTAYVADTDTDQGRVGSN
jgi:hypothetical protein